MVRNVPYLPLRVCVCWSRRSHTAHTHRHAKRKRNIVGRFLQLRRFIMFSAQKKEKSITLCQNIGPLKCCYVLALAVFGVTLPLRSTYTSYPAGHAFIVQQNSLLPVLFCTVGSDGLQHKRSLVKAFRRSMVGPKLQRMPVRTLGKSPKCNDAYCGSIILARRFGSGQSFVVFCFLNGQRVADVCHFV